MIALLKTLGLMSVGLSLNLIWIFFTWLLESHAL